MYKREWLLGEKYSDIHICVFVISHILLKKEMTAYNIRILISVWLHFLRAVFDMRPVKDTKKGEL